MTTKTKQRKPTLPTVAPAWLEAKIDTDNARQRLVDAKRHVVVVVQANEAHTSEIVEIGRKSNDYKLVTNGTALAFGSGGSFNIVHHRCRCEEACDHDPAKSPYSPEAIAAADRAVLDAESVLTNANADLDGTDSEFDAFANAREAKASHVWWPQARYVDPRLRRWRGKPLTASDVDDLGPHELNRCVVAGSIIEVG